MQTLTERQLRFLAVVTNRLAAMDGRALFHAMQEDPKRRGWLKVYNKARDGMLRYAMGMVEIRAELARRGLS